MCLYLSSDIFLFAWLVFQFYIPYVQFHLKSSPPHFVASGGPTMCILLELMLRKDAEESDITINWLISFSTCQQLN